jgi:Leucine-rich repeat (LRR) protein
MGTKPPDRQTGRLRAHRLPGERGFSGRSGLFKELTFMNTPARFCVGCGAALQASAQFCTKCGAAQPAPSTAVSDGAPIPAGASHGRLGRIIIFGIAALMLVFCAWLFWESQKPVPQFNQAKFDETIRAEVQKKLQQALSSPEGVTKLELNGGNLTSLPADFPKLQNLRELAIHDNATLDFTAVFSLLAKIPALERLDLAETDLQTLPAEIGGLVNLKELLLWHNELKTLPEEIGSLQKIEWINLAMNSIESLPAGMGKLRSLTHLDLSQNGLKSVPGAVFEMPSLKSLDLSKNIDLASIPADIGKLKRLEFLGLAFNSELKHLPLEIGQLQNLQEITGLEAGFLDAPETAEISRSLKNVRISGKAEGQLLNQMQSVENEAAKIEEEREQKKKNGRLIR